MLRYSERPLNLPAYQHSFHLSSIPSVLPAAVSCCLLVGPQLFSQGKHGGEDEGRGGAELQCKWVWRERQQKQEEERLIEICQGLRGNRHFVLQ